MDVEPVAGGKAFGELRNGMRPVGRYAAMMWTRSTPFPARRAVRNCSMLTRMWRVSAVIVTGATPLVGML